MMASSLGLMSCEDVLDKKNLSAITEQDVWKDPALATAFVNNVYLSVPSWDVFRSRRRSSVLVFQNSQMEESE